MIKIYATLFITILLLTQGLGQYSSGLIPRVSSDNSISERIAYTKISIEYGSPKVHGREIWGEMEEYGQIWRAGANKATSITFSENVRIQGNSLSKGTYSFFIIPQESGPWQLIFNKVAEQWGAFNYDEKEDALRIEVPAQVNKHVEDLTFDIQANHFQGAFVTMEWEEIKLSFFVEVEHLRILEKMVDEKVALAPVNIQWVIYLQAANYLVDEEERLDLAESWLEMSLEQYPTEGEWSGQYYPKEYIMGDLLWAKAKLAGLQGNYKKAIEMASEMKSIEGDYVFYARENESEQIDERISQWQKLK